MINKILTYILLYWCVLFIAVVVSGCFFKRNMRDIAREYLPLAAFAQVFITLISLRIALDIETINPYRLGGRGIYGLYAKCFFILVLIPFMVYAGRSLKSSKIRFKSVIHIVLLVYAEYYFLCDGHYFLAGISVFSFLIGYFRSDLMGGLWNKIAGFIASPGKHERAVIWGIFLVGFIVRFAFSLRIMSITGDDFLRASDDGLTYAPYGVSWAKGIIPPEGLYWGGFGYWVFLGIIFRIFGEYNYYAATFFQSLAGAIVPVAAFLLAKRSFNNFTAYITAFFTVLDMNLIFLTAVIGMESIYIPIVYLGLLMFIYFSEQTGSLVYKLFAVGLVMGLANMVRIEFVYFPFIAVMIFVAHIRRRGNIKNALTAGTALILGFLMVLSVHCYRNYANYGQFTYKTAQAEVCFAKNVNGSGENQELASMGFNPFANPGKALTCFLGNPAQVTELLLTGFVKKAWLFFFIPNFGTFDPIILVNPDSGFVFAYPVSVLVYGYLLAIFGFCAAWMNKRSFSLKIITAYIIYIASLYSIIMVTNARHRGVLVPFFFMFLAYGMYVLAKFIKSGDDQHS